jgi:DNA-binding NtrC family response regulator
MRPTILIVDDDEAVLASLGLLLKQSGYTAKKAKSPQQALELLQAGGIDLVLQDMNFSARQTGGEEGLQLLGQIKAAYPTLPVVLMTAWGSIALAVAGVQAGASDFITKPWTHAQLQQALRTVLGMQALGQERELSRKDLDARHDFGHIIGEDPRLLRLLEIVGRVAQTDAPVLITGESGTGKELIAEALHRNSPRKSEALVRVNLGSVPASLFESELFGHVRGAFTDAKADRKGRFELADRGTIFLDEIGDLDPNCQVKLLRVLQDRTFEAVGDSRSRTADVRVVSATNKNLGELVQRGQFREDLLYRLNLIALHLPPLRERRGDIPKLAAHFLEQAAKVYRKGQLRIGEAAMRWLQARPFPGNIRELRHLIERAVIMSNGSVLEPADFQDGLALEQGGAEAASPAVALGDMSLEEMEKAMIVQALQQYPDNLGKAAEVLGISRYALYRRMEKFGLG